MDAAAIVRELRSAGHAVLPSVIPPEHVARLRDELDPETGPAVAACAAAHASARFAQVCMCRQAVVDGQRSPRQEAPLRWQVHNEARGGDNAHAQAQIAWPSRTPSLLASTPPLKLCAACGGHR